MTCPEMNKNLADLMLESHPLPAEACAHIAECVECANELAAMERTWKLLDEWQAPEPSVFFDARLFARLRTEQTAAPASFFERAKAWLLFSSNLQMRQVGAGALAAVLVVGGGSFALLDHQQAPVVQASATVRDLQSYDGNAQVFQQLNALDADDDGNSASN